MFLEICTVKKCINIWNEKRKKKIKKYRYNSSVKKNKDPLLGNRSNHTVWEDGICHQDHVCLHILEALSHQDSGQKNLYCFW